MAVPPDRDASPVQQFQSFTADLERLADWLIACRIDTVAMESTGVYWIPVYEYLEARGFTVFLVNARHVKSVSGRKSDVLDCQWLQQLVSYGLLSGAFRPGEAVCALRAVMRQRDMLVASQARHVQHMQKALTQMNIQLANVISDIVGETGQRIVRAIVAGERDGGRLAALRGTRIRASEAEIARALAGTWREEHLFALKQAVALFDAYGAQSGHMPGHRKAGGQVEPDAAGMGELLSGRHRQQGISGTRQLHRGAVAPVVACQAQGQATKRRDLSTSASLRALRARASDCARKQPAVGESMMSCPRAGCGRSACPVR